MSLQICPKCGVMAITWFLDEDVSPFTLWTCSSCGYTIEEDEKRKYDCLRCASAKGCLLVKDKEGFYRWCSACGLFESTTETFST